MDNSGQGNMQPLPEGVAQTEATFYPNQPANLQPMDPNKQVNALVWDLKNDSNFGSGIDKIDKHFRILSLTSCSNDFSGLSASKAANQASRLFFF